MYVLTTSIPVNTSVEVCHSNPPLLVCGSHIPKEKKKMERETETLLVPFRADQRRKCWVLVFSAFMYRHAKLCCVYVVPIIASRKYIAIHIEEATKIVDYHEFSVIIIETMRLILILQ
ncbi:hypothetical protein L1049_015922 [Liquidambar formosana]|uniref:Uncharacterized protein n=1 Tax=Liquidambar formosana TaxID=63359 RepID=A0AAP0WZF1_LIQFO